ncbi:MAG: SDR family NAD(P)-dependent oxidoreductase [Rhizobiaceae bacterium]|nr:SDR family NAD(P)-dependent oxidoreductase [Rhizobiaceae bacterium]
MQKTWFITGASRGLGTHIALAALRAGDRVVATGRKRENVNAVLGPDSDKLLAVSLDVTDAGQVQAAVDAAVARFGGIDVLVNNAGYGHLGFFEENTMEDVEAQFDTNLYGAFRVTWAALPVMRAAGKGQIFNLSSLGGLRGAEFGSLYCATKFALEGFSEALAAELKPFGISVTIIEPGPFRTDFLTRESLRLGGKTIADYDERRAAQQASFESRNGFQPGNPQKLADAMVLLTREAEPPMRFIAGKMAVDGADAKFKGMLAELDRWRDLGVSTDGDMEG